MVEYENGFMAIPDKAGLEIGINEKHVRKMPVIGYNWKNPLWLHKEGSVAAW